MISEKDLQEAIAECLGQRSPNANTCIKLAAFYTIKNQLYGEKEVEQDILPPSYSYAPAPDERIRQYGDTPFYKAIAGRTPDDIWHIIDEVFTALMAVNPRLYQAAMRKLS